MNKIVLTEEFYRRGKLCAGHSYRMGRFLAKLKSGAGITYGAIGGSITEGACASEPLTRYVEVFAARLREKYGSDIQTVNAGIGASNSLFGVFRVDKDLLCHTPDIITVDYSVNDISNPEIKGSYEALIRKCLLSSPDVPVILLAMVDRDGANTQQIHLPIGAHYQLPMLSYRDAIYPEVSSGRIEWTDISPDRVHPNDAGHAFLGAMLERFVEENEQAACAQEPDEIADILDDRARLYLNPQIQDASVMAIAGQQGWVFGPHKGGYTGLQSETIGAWVEVKFTGRYVALGSQQFSGDFGRLRVWLDGVERATVEGYYQKIKNPDWAGGHTILTVIDDKLTGGEHTLRMELLPEKHPNSNGHRFDIGYLLIGG